jgi:hypothetical protein
MLISEFVTTLKELQLVYGNAIQWEEGWEDISIYVIRNRNKDLMYTAVLGSSRLDGSSPDIVATIFTPSGRQIQPQGFKNYVKVVLDKYR